MSSTSVNIFIGVDVSKDTLSVARNGKVITIANTRTAIRQFLKTVPEGSYVAMEATNTYHVDLADIAYSFGMRVYVLNPQNAKKYREMTSARGKTDPIDARALASMIEREHDLFRAYKPLPENVRKLQMLIRRRSKIVGVKKQLKSSMKDLKEFGKHLEEILRKCDELIAVIDAAIDRTLEGNADRSRVQSIPGVGAVTSAAMICALERGEFRSADSFTAFFGLDPRPNDSGKHRGRRHISKHGEREGRRLLYVAAMAAVRTCAWIPLYKRLTGRGFSRIQALVSIARRIARTAWSIYTHGTTFRQERLFAA